MGDPVTYVRIQEMSNVEGKVEYCLAKGEGSFQSVRIIFLCLALTDYLVIDRVWY